IRLAYFNVTEETRQATEMGRRTHYEGLPVTSDALVFSFAYLMTRLLPHPAALFVYPAFLLVTAVLFISPIRVPKPHGRGLVFLSLIGLCELAALACLYMGLF
ncbi:MAG: phosphatidylserine synthase, partial [Clostridia bacterium]|nr:phosphatidylserine synthase [Clostridia bacterium]